jgi:hypothetical protein
VSVQTGDAFPATLIETIGQSRFRSGVARALAWKNRDAGNPSREELSGAALDPKHGSLPFDADRPNSGIETLICR